VLPYALYSCSAFYFLTRYDAAGTCHSHGYICKQVLLALFLSLLRKHVELPGPKIQSPGLYMQISVLERTWFACLCIFGLYPEGVLTGIKNSHEATQHATSPPYCRVLCLSRTIPKSHLRCGIPPPAADQAPPESKKNRRKLGMGGKIRDDSCTTHSTGPNKKRNMCHAPHPPRISISFRESPCYLFHNPTTTTIIVNRLHVG
jgi:hypothetical protein